MTAAVQFERKYEREREMKNIRRRSKKITFFFLFFFLNGMNTKLPNAAISRSHLLHKYILWTDLQRARRRHIDAYCCFVRIWKRAPHKVNQLAGIALWFCIIFPPLRYYNRNRLVAIASTVLHSNHTLCMPISCDATYWHEYMSCFIVHLPFTCHSFSDAMIFLGRTSRLDNGNCCHATDYSAQDPSI